MKVFYLVINSRKSEVRTLRIYNILFIIYGIVFNFSVIVRAGHTLQRYLLLRDKAIFSNF